MTATLAKHVAGAIIETRHNRKLQPTYNIPPTNSSHRQTQNVFICVRDIETLDRRLWLVEIWLYSCHIPLALGCYCIVYDNMHAESLLPMAIYKRHKIYIEYKICNQSKTPLGRDRYSCKCLYECVYMCAPVRTHVRASACVRVCVCMCVGYVSCLCSWL